MCQNEHNALRKAYGNLGGEMGDGAEKQGMKCVMWAEMRRRGVAGKGSRSTGCRGAEHGQACTKDCTGVVALMAAHKSAV
jgi:hypothetical protein